MKHGSGPGGKLWSGFLRLLTRRAVTLLTLLFVGIVIATLVSMAQLSQALVQSQATQNAILAAQALKEASLLYSERVAEELKDLPGIQITHDHLNQVNAIPIPSTYLIELSRHIQAKNMGMSVRLYSDYPFPWRQKDGGPRNDFERQALAALRKNPAQPYIRFRDEEGRPVLQYAEASLMKSSCIDCHNRYAGSPKTDWRVGDLRGVLEIVQPLESYEIQTREGLKHMFLLLSGISVVGVGGLTLALGDLRRRITERCQAEEALRIAEENYRSIFENAVEGIFQSSPEGRYLRGNAALSRIYGYDSCREMIEQITDIGRQIYVDPERRQEFQRRLETEGTVKNFEYRSYRKDGEIIWTQIDARLVKDHQGRVLYYEGRVQDISERKRREAELRQQLADLKVEIDQGKRQQDLAQLTQSNFFLEVQQEIETIDLESFWR